MEQVHAAARATTSALELQLDGILELASELTSIDSGSESAEGVEAVSRVVEQRLVPLGFTSTWHEIGDDRGRGLELVRTLGSTGVRVLVLGHADTVWPEGTVAEWPIDIDADHMSGPGLGDMKCAIAMAVYAIAAALDTELPGVASITLALVSDEELGSVGSRVWLEELGQRTDVCLTLEAGLAGGGVITSRGSVGAMILTATGRTAHSTETTGVSAVSALASLVGELESLTNRDERTICLAGVLRGGTARQVVPENCELHVDLRAPTREAATQLVEQVGQLARAKEIPGLQIDVSGGVTRQALAQTGSDPVYTLASAISCELGIQIHRFPEMGGSDASIVGVHAPLFLDGLGPIAFKQCSREERVDRASVLPRAALLSALIMCAGSLQVPRAGPG